MARDPFVSLLRAAGRAAASAQRESQRQMRASAAYAERVERQARMAEAQQHRQHAKFAKQQERADKVRYLEERQAEASDLNDEVKDVLADLEGLIGHTLAINDTISFGSLRLTAMPPKFALPPELKPVPAPQAPVVSPPSGISKFMPGAKGRHEQELLKAERQHAALLEDHAKQESARMAKVATAMKQHEQALAAFKSEKENRDAEVDRMELAYNAGEVDASPTTKWSYRAHNTRSSGFLNVSDALTRRMDDSSSSSTTSQSRLSYRHPRSIATSGRRI
jgi:restriction system protein